MSEENLTEIELTDYEGWDDAANSIINEEIIEDDNSDSVEDVSENTDSSDKDDNKDVEPDNKESEESKELPSEEDGEDVSSSNEVYGKIGLVEKNGEVGKMVKIDGEEQFVPLKDLGNDYSGQQALQRRFNEVDKEKKNFETQIEQVNQYINDLGETLKGNNGVINGLGEIAKLVGISPAQVQRQAIQELIPVINRLSEMDEDSRSLYFDKMDLDYNRSLLESEQAKVHAGKSEMEAQAKWSKFRQANGISDSEFDNIAEELRANGEEVSEAKVLEELSMKRSFDKATTALKTFDSKLISDEKVLDNLVEICQKFPDFTQEELVEILEQSLGKSKEENVKQKLNNKQTKKPVKKEEVIDEEGFLDWDEI